MDDFTRVMWVYMLVSKDQALEAFRKFRVQVEKETDKRIKALRIDRGREFLSRQYESYCEDNDIVRQFTAPYTLQQNRFVERRNHTVVSMARSLLKEKQIPAVMWGEAVRHDVYLLNRLPTCAVAGKTPYEVWTGNKPDIGHIKILGSLAYMKILNAYVKKLDDHSKKVVYIGREPGVKACRLFDRVSRKILVSRDVVIDEDKNWDWNSGYEDGFASILGNFVIQGTFKVENTNSGDQVTTGGGNEDVATSEDSSSGSISQTAIQSSDENDSESTDQSGSSEPRNFRLLSEVYNDTSEIKVDKDMLMLGVEEPTSYDQAAIQDSWHEAMKTEINAIERNKTWELVELPPGHKPIGVKWVYKLKIDAKRDVIKHKARLVVKGYVQKRGIDFEEVFAPVTRLKTVKLLLALAAKNEWEVHHLDVKSAFLNVDFQESVFLTQLDGFVKKGEENFVYKLAKALYGLRQAPSAWYAKLSKYLEALGFVKCPYEHAVYTKREENAVLVVGVYVDDLIITSTSTSMISNFKR